jgi:hypothetical protein
MKVLQLEDGKLTVTPKFYSMFMSQLEHRENVDRKKIGYRDTDIYRDNMHRYVLDWLKERAHLTDETIEEIPVVSSINLTKRVVDQEASIYKNQPARKWSELNEQQIKSVERMYKDFWIDYKLKSCNQNYKLQRQNHLMLVPKNGKIKVRSLRQQNIDVIPDPQNPEEAFAYIISIFDQSEVYKDVAEDNRKWFKNQQDDLNEGHADSEDYKSNDNLFVVWTKEHNFMMNGNGEIVLQPEDLNEDGTLKAGAIENH